MSHQKLEIEEVKKILQSHPDWFLSDDEKYLETGLEFAGFKQAASFMQDLADLSDKLQHHPDVYIYDYKFMQIMVHTHDADKEEGGALTQKDIDFIKAFDEAYEAATEHDTTEANENSEEVDGVSGDTEE